MRYRHCRMVFGIFLIIGSSSCQSAEPFCRISSVSSGSNIVSAVCHYYEHESASAWNKTYEMRTPAFKSLVPFSAYADQMNRDSKEWKLERVEITKIREQDKKAFIDLTFLERKISEKDSDKGKTMKFQGSAIWINKEGNWYCYDCVTRAHLTLNAPIAPEPN